MTGVKRVTCDNHSFLLGTDCVEVNQTYRCRAQNDWLGRISSLTPHFLTASGCSDLPIIQR